MAVKSLIPGWIDRPLLRLLRRLLTSGLHVAGPWMFLEVADPGPHWEIRLH